MQKINQFNQKSEVNLIKGGASNTVMAVGRQVIMAPFAVYLKCLAGVNAKISAQVYPVEYRPEIDAAL